MRIALAVALFVSCAVFADVLAQQNGTTLGPVRAVNCPADAGIVCSRTNGTPAENLRCTTATSSEPGCLFPGVQTLPNGDKTFPSPVKISGVSHGSLEACDSSHLGTRQTCSTHGAEVFCNGTTNIEYTGTASAEQVLGVIHVNGIPVAVMGGSFQTPTSATTVTAIEGSWFAGTTSDGGTVLINLKNGGSTCTCTVPCASSAVRNTCSGTCTNLGAAATLTSSSTCTTDPYVGGELLVKGVLQ